MRGTWPANLGSCFSSGTECVCVCVCVSVCVSSHLPMLFLLLLSMYFSSAASRNTAHTHSQTHRYAHAHTHTHRQKHTHTHTHRRPHQGYRGNACGIVSVFEVMPLILKQIWTLCCASPAVCEWACPCVKPNLTPITLRLAAHQRHPTATPTWKSGAGLASSTPALIWGQKPTIASHRDAETERFNLIGPPPDNKSVFWG